MKRLAAYLPDPVFEELEKWATEEKRSLSNLVGFLLEAAVRERQKDDLANQSKEDHQGN
jgi:hypothetical protein